MPRDEIAIRSPDRPDATPEIEQTNRMQIVSLYTERMLPVDLIGKGVPGKAMHWNS
jgi:hypothetical protein